MQRISYKECKFFYLKKFEYSLRIKSEENEVNYLVTYNEMIKDLKGELKKSQDIFDLFNNYEEKKQAEILETEEMEAIFDYNKRRLTLYDETVVCVSKAFDIFKENLDNEIKERYLYNTENDKVDSTSDQSKPIGES